ncbi:hypothetical protein M9Y10_046009 [Tritrichomonas musculus]|uniref:Ubiquitin-like domain-containing protein n=1 Tax=Tritrichomonas musculus TaxID=1915356 RepID=A0ABR2JX47_9EUKA
MKKKVFFLIKYLGPNDETVSRPIEATPTISIKDIRVQIKKDIPQFSDRDIVLIRHNQVLEDDCTIGQLSQQNDLIILILPKIISINICYGKENPKRIDMDITLPIKKTIEKFFKNNKLRKKNNFIYYSLAYEKKLYPEISEKELKKKKLKQKKKKSSIKYQTCCSDLPLYTHKWWYSNFYLIRRLSLEDENITNDEERRFLIDQSNFLDVSGLSVYRPEDWTELISYQYYFQTNDKNLTKEKLEVINITPPSFDCSMKSIQLKLNEISSCSLRDSQNEYIRKAIRCGCQCAYAENIKMRWMRFWSKYKIYVSSMNVMIFSGNGKTFQYMKEIDNIDHIELQGANIYSNFDQNEIKDQYTVNNLKETPEIQNSLDEIKNLKKNENANIDNNYNDKNQSNNKNNDSDNNNSDTNVINNEIKNETLNNNSSNNIISENNNENALGITIYFNDNTSWEMVGDSQVAVSRLKVVLDQMIAINHKIDSENLLDNNLSLTNKEDDNDTEESLNKILGEEIGVFNPGDTIFDNSSRNSFAFDLQRQTTSYPHYSVILTPDEIGDKVIFKDYKGYNQGNNFDYLKENIQAITFFQKDYDTNDDNLPINNNDHLLVNFFAFGPTEKGHRNIFILFLSFFLVIYFCNRYFRK